MIKVVKINKVLREKFLFKDQYNVDIVISDRNRYKHIIDIANLKIF